MKDMLQYKEQYQYVIHQIAMERVILIVVDVIIHAEMDVEIVVKGVTVVQDVDPDVQMVVLIRVKMHVLIYVQEVDLKYL